ncbi:MAG: diguanylate cyclase [Fibromonadales bacterium]|nr:diguanylate cyclase [Fibromonadales bacterium]
MSILIIVLAIINAVVYSTIKRLMEDQFQLAGQSTAVVVASIISEDLDGYRQFLATRDTSSEYYVRMQGYFNNILKTSNLRFIYTINRINNKYIEIILDSEPTSSKYYSAPGSIETMNKTTSIVFDTKQPTKLKPTRSAFGHLLGGCAPILDEQGELLGVVGVDIDYSEIFFIVQQLFIALTTIFILLLVFIYFLLSKISHYFLEPMLKDKLTGAYNKRYFEAILKKSIDAALEAKQELSVLMLDLDYFKKINDTYGHIFGDIVLAKTAGWIRESLRKDDFFVRYGGEEFAVLQFNIDASVAANLAERIRKTIESHNIYNAEKNISITMTISIGIANLQKRNVSALELVKEADKALYEAKKTRNTVMTFLDYKDE